MATRRRNQRQPTMNLIQTSPTKLGTQKKQPKTQREKKKSDLDQSHKVRGTKLAKPTPETFNRARTGQGGNEDNNIVVTKVEPDHRMSRKHKLPRSDLKKNQG